MKVFLSVDMEGIGGIVSEKETDPVNGGEAYQASRRRMTAETNAAIEGAIEAGAEEALVADSHWNFDNLIPEDLHEAAVLLRGHPRSHEMMHGLDGTFAAALLVGYHAMAGAPRAILDHTFTGRIRSVEVNGLVVGETGLSAYLAGHFGVPVVLVTGDAAVTAEARALLPHVQTATVKEAVSATAARNLHPKKAQALIRAEAAKGIRGVGTATPLRATSPVAIAIDFKGTEAADRAEVVPGVRRVGGTRIEFEAKDFLEAFRAFDAAIGLAHAD